jgi:uncharacterized protein YcfJ
MRTQLRNAALALTLSATFATGVPAIAATAFAPQASQAQADSWQQYRQRHYNGYGQRAYAEPVYANTPVWRGDDGRYYCKKKNGTTGMIIGGAAGALAGRAIAGRGDNTIGTIAGGVAGALLGREIQRSSGRRTCR